jgi:small subunit ribosomal protein S1
VCIDACKGGKEKVMSEEMNKETATPVETMEDYAAELEASYAALNKNSVEETLEDGPEAEKWAEFARKMEEKEIVKVKISEAVKGGVVAYVDEVRAFIPASQLSTEYVEKLEDWQGKHVETYIITVDPEKKRLVLSGREVEREKKAAEKKERLAQFKAGDVVEGTVDSIKNYGAFIKLADGVDGLLHISQISTQRIKHPGVVLEEGQKVKVKILSAADGKLSLSMKALTEQKTDREEHETFNYKETGTASTGLGDLLKGLKF